MYGFVFRPLDDFDYVALYRAREFFLCRFSVLFSGFSVWTTFFDLYLSFRRFWTFRLFGYGACSHFLPFFRIRLVRGYSVRGLKELFESRDTMRRSSRRSLFSPGWFCLLYGDQVGVDRRSL